MMKLRRVVLVAALFCFHGIALAQEPIKISTISDASQPASVEMMKLFRQKIGEHSALFKLVGNDDASLGLVSKADCMPRQSKDAPYVCFYTLQYAGGTNKTFMGGGVNAARTANDIADGFLSSMAQDIVEELDHARRGNAVESLEACLFLTQSSCSRDSCRGTEGQNAQPLTIPTKGGLKK